MALTQISDAGLQKPASDLQDNEKIVLGTGNDFELVHDGSNSYIQEDGAGQLIIRAWAPEIQAGYSPSSSRSTGETAIKALTDGAVELYYNAVKKFETTSAGATVTGGLLATDTNPSIAEFYHSDGGTNDEARISLGAYSSNPPAQRGITLVGKNNGAGHDFIVNTSNSHSLGPTEKLWVKSDGKVGIGISTPDQTLHVRKGDAGGVDSASSSVITIENSDHATLQFLTPNDKNQQIRFGDVQDTGSGWIEYSHSTNALIIGTNGPEKVRIDSSGRVGIGEASPSTLLNLKGTAGGGATGVKIVNTADEYSALILDANRSGAGNALGIIEGRWNGNTNCAIYLTSGVDTTNKDDGDIRFFTRPSGGSIGQRAVITRQGWFKAKGDHTSYLNDANYHEFQSNNASNVLMNMKHHNAAGYGLIMKFEHAGTQMYALRIYDEANGNDRAYIRTDGDFESANNSYGAISDVKLKENIVDAKSQWDDIKALRIRNFNFKSDSSKKKMLGLVAQEAESVCPSLVKTQTDFKGDTEDAGTTTKVLKYSILYMKAIKALQEAITKIETLETKVAALEAA